MRGRGPRPRPRTVTEDMVKNSLEFENGSSPMHWDLVAWYSIVTQLNSNSFANNRTVQHQLAGCQRGLSLSKLATHGYNKSAQQLHTATTDLATHFTTKVSKVRQSTAAAAPPVIHERPSETLSTLQPVTAEEVVKLLAKAPTKHCRLDPIPTWLIK